MMLQVPQFGQALLQAVVVVAPGMGVRNENGLTPSWS